MNQIASRSWVGTVFEQRPDLFTPSELQEGNSRIRLPFCQHLFPVIFGIRWQFPFNLGDQNRDYLFGLLFQRWKDDGELRLIGVHDSFGQPSMLTENRSTADQNDKRRQTE